MKGKTIAAAVVAVVVVLGIAACSVAWESSIDPIEPPQANSFDQATLARGVQLAAVGDCMSCHSAVGAPPFSGGLPLQTPFGTIYSTNITPDPDTGIGHWSLEAFSRAMRRGVARDGHLLYPAFPYPHFTHMTDDDIKALYAYMMTRTPVHAQTPENSLSFPFSFRPLIAGWNLLFLRKGELPADPAQSAEWLRGRYLVEGPGHCAACHTPMNTFGAEKSGAAFAGGFIDGWDVPPLNALVHARKPWTVDQLTSYLRTGLAVEHGAAAGPMLPVTRVLGDVSDNDVRAMATYLLSQQVQTAPAAPQAAANPAAGVDAQRLQRGGTLFTSTCASCHADSAPMRQIGDRPSLALSSTLNSDSPRNVINLILAGIPTAQANTSHYMPAFANTLSDADIADVATYLRVQIAERPVWASLDDTVAKIRKESKPQ